MKNAFQKILKTVKVFKKTGANENKKIEKQERKLKENGRKK